MGFWHLIFECIFSSHTHTHTTQGSKSQVLQVEEPRIRSPLAEKPTFPPRSPLLSSGNSLKSPILPPPKLLHSALLTPRNLAFGYDGDSVSDDDESVANFSDDDEEQVSQSDSAPNNNLDYLDTPVAHHHIHDYDEEQLFGAKPKSTNGILKKGLASENLTIQVPNSVRRFTDGELGFKKCVQNKLTPDHGTGGVQLQKQIHLRNLNSLDDPIELTTPSAPPIIDVHFPHSQGAVRNEVGETAEHRSWPSRESVDYDGRRSESSIEQKQPNTVGERY